MSEVKILALAFLAVLAAASHGTDYAWNGGTSGEWTTASNWSPSTGYPNGSGDMAWNDWKPATMKRDCTSQPVTMA